MNSISTIGGRREWLFIFLAGLFVTNAVTAELISNKLIDVPIHFNLFGNEFGPFTTIVGILPWPIVFLLTDLMNEFYGDHAYSFEIGEVAPEVKKLLKVTKESLYVGIKEFRVGNRVEDVGSAIQKYTESHGYGVVRELVGHGLGQKMHEDPEMPNYGKRGRGKLFVEGMVVAIEPMINMGTRNIKQLKDGWTILTADGKPSAHFEHDVALIDGKPELLSTFAYIYKALGIESNEEDEFRKEPLKL